MSTVTRTINLNPVEPAPMSLKAPSGMETWVNIRYRTQQGGPWTTDVAAQLQLTGRSDSRTLSYSVPATDALNGNARAVIPAGDLTDPNGYRLRLVGTVDRQPALIATGLVTIFESAGYNAVPDDVIDLVNIVLNYAVDNTIVVTLWHDNSKTNPYTLEAADITAVVLTGTASVPFVVTEDGNQAILTMDAATVNTLPPACTWQLTASTATGSQLLAQGDVTVLGTPM